MAKSPFWVTGTKEDDWTITKEPAQWLYSSGSKEIQECKRIDFAKMIIYPDGCGDFEDNKSTVDSFSTWQRRTLMKQPGLQSSDRRHPAELPKMISRKR